MAGATVAVDEWSRFAAGSDCVGDLRRWRARVVTATATADW
jgi:hypothetical protein